MAESGKDKNKEITSQVAEHYNKIQLKDVRDRTKSDIIELRRFNNAMKSLLYHLSCKFAKNSCTEVPQERFRILDLGCGKGGDVPKYARDGRIGKIVGVDVADVSIQQCKERFASRRQIDTHLEGEFFVADLTRENISEKLKELGCTEKFHIATCQFSIHYGFESFDQAVRYISNAAENLLPRGVFVGTYPDGPKLLKLARQSATPGTYSVSDLLKVTFSPADLENPKPFGTKYHFKLKEVVDCPEFLTHPRIFRALMESLGLHLVFDRSFEENIKNLRESPADSKAFKHIIEVHNAMFIDWNKNVASLSEDMWRAASVYRCFCYMKI